MPLCAVGAPHALSCCACALSGRNGSSDQRPLSRAKASSAPGSEVTKPDPRRARQVWGKVSIALERPDAASSAVRIDEPSAVIGRAPVSA